MMRISNAYPRLWRCRAPIPWQIREVELSVNILALDLGSKTGYAAQIAGELLVGTWNLSTAKEVKAWGHSRLTRRNDPRIRRLHERVAEFCGRVDAIIIEDVLFASSTFQVQMWASLRAAVWLSCRDCDIYFDAVPVATIKKFFTGAGNATKEMMAAAAPETIKQFDDNAIDAYAILTWAQNHILRAIRA